MAKIDENRLVGLCRDIVLRRDDLHIGINLGDGSAGVEYPFVAENDKLGLGADF